MPSRDSLHTPFLLFEIGVEKINQNDRQRNKSKESGLPPENMAQNRRHRYTCHKHRQHQQMAEQAHKLSVITVLAVFRYGNGKLAQMIGAECSRHRNALRLPEGIVLH